MVYRWWAKMLCPQLVSWEAQHSGPWDAASKGMGAEAGSFEEEATTELHLLNGGVVAGILADLAKFL